MGISDQFSQFMPEFTKGAVTGIVMNFIWALIAIVLIAGAGSWIAYVSIRRKKFSNLIVVYSKVGGRFTRTITDKAMEMAVGDAGDTIYYCAKTKRYLPRPELQMGPNEYWYFIKADGEWINFDLTDMDEKMREVGAHFLDKEMRYARAGLQKNLRERYSKPGFWEKYGGMVAYATLIVVVGIMMYLLFGKFSEVGGSLTAAVHSAEVVMSKTESVLGALDNIGCGGSGLRAASALPLTLLLFGRKKRRCIKYGNNIRRL